MMKQFMMICVAMIMCMMGTAVVGALDLSACEQRTFIVTAYYSPLDNQHFYYKGNVTAEKNLNGQGTHGASGRPVFDGMLAAPSTYNFGDVILLSGRGTGIVHDRGGAIVKAGQRGFEHDRLDIWMGRGEIGLMQALTFGKRTLEGYYCPQSEQHISQVGFDLSQIPLFYHFFDTTLWLKEIPFEEYSPWVGRLQHYLKDLGYLASTHTTSIYDETTRRAICAFQRKEGIVGSHNKSSCGVYGPMTRARLRAVKTEKKLRPQHLWQHTTWAEFQRTYFAGDLRSYQESHALSLSRLPSTQSDGSSQEKKSDGPIMSGQTNNEFIRLPQFVFYQSYQKNQSHREIKILQRIFELLGLYQGPVNGVYNQSTINAVYAFQQRHQLISESDALELRGFFGPATRSVLNDLIRQSR